MIKGITRPNEVSHLGLSNRLLARVGALLKKKFAATLAALEAAKPGSPIEALLLRSELLHEAAALTSERLTTLVKESGVDAALAIADGDDGMRVLCLEDELEADAGWAEETVSQVTRPLPIAHATATGSIQPLPVAHAGADGGVYGEDHLARTRLKWMTSSDAGERIEALRVLVLSPLTPAEKAEVILHGLSDTDESVRSEAASLLPGLGVSADVAAALADLNKGDVARRMAAADKLDKIAARGSDDLANGATIVCAMSALKSDAERALKIRLLNLLAGRAETVGRNISRMSEVLRVAIGLISAAFKIGPSSRELDEFTGAAHRLAKELGRFHPDNLKTILKTERERASDAAVEAFALGALFELIPSGHADEDALLSWSAAFLARDTEEGRGSRAIGALLTRRGGAALEKLCGVFALATPGAQKHVLILLDEMCRKPDARTEDFARAAAVILSAMESGSKALRMAAMECRLVFDARVPAETRRLLAEAFLDSAGDFTFPSDTDKAESAVQRMGAPAVAPLIARLGRDRAPNERIRAARLLGELALVAKSEQGAAASVAASGGDIGDAGTAQEAARDGGGPSGGFHFLQQALTDALRRLEAASLEMDFPDRGEVFCALGKVISSPAAAMEANAVVTRTLLDAAKSGDAKLAPRALEGVSFLAASRRATPELFTEALTLLKAALAAPEPAQLETQSKSAGGDTVFEIQGGEHYAIDLPIVLSGLERLALAPNCPAGQTRDIGALLLERWKDICSGQLVWGPANVYTLLQALRSIALSDRCGAELRLAIVKGLYARLYQTPAMQALVDILTADDTRDSAGVALSIGFAILARRDPEGRFSESDRADILVELARLATRKSLLAPAAETERTPTAFRRTVVGELIKGVKDQLPGVARALEALCESGALPAELRAEVERRCKPRAELLRS